jgi:uncharacterized membrane protein YidH (DUF202 family)
VTGDGSPRFSQRVGAQAERTEMAWVRTTLTCAGLAVAAIRFLGSLASTPVALAAGVAVALPGLVASWWRVTDLRSRPEPEPPRLMGAALLAGSVVVVGLIVLAEILW